MFLWLVQCTNTRRILTSSGFKGSNKKVTEGLVNGLKIWRYLKMPCFSCIATHFFDVHWNWNWWHHCPLHDCEKLKHSSPWLPTGGDWGLWPSVAESSGVGLAEKWRRIAAVAIEFEGWLKKIRRIPRKVRLVIYFWTKNKMNGGLAEVTNCP